MNRRIAELVNLLPYLWRKRGVAVFDMRRVTCIKPTRADGCAGNDSAPTVVVEARGVVVEAGRESFIVSRNSVVDFVRGDAEMTGFDVIQSLTLWEEILSLIVWASAVGGLSLAVLVMTASLATRDKTPR